MVLHHFPACVPAIKVENKKCCVVRCNHIIPWSFPVALHLQCALNHYTCTASQKSALSASSSEQEKLLVLSHQTIYLCLQPQSWMTKDKNCVNPFFSGDCDVWLCPTDLRVEISHSGGFYVFLSQYFHFDWSWGELGWEVVQEVRQVAGFSMDNPHDVVSCLENMVNSTFK